MLSTLNSVVNLSASTSVSLLASALRSPEPNATIDSIRNDIWMRFRKYAEPTANTLVGVAKFGVVGTTFALAGPLAGAAATIIVGGLEFLPHRVDIAAREDYRHVSAKDAVDSTYEAPRIAEQLLLLDPDSDEYRTELKELDWEIGKLNYVVSRLARTQRSIPALALYLPERAIQSLLGTSVYLRETQYYMLLNDYSNALNKFREDLPDR